MAGHFRLLATLLVAVPMVSAQAPPSPAWLADITRVAYTDLPNTTTLGDWPDQVIADFAAAGVQMTFSRAHNGSYWHHLAWRGQFGRPDPSMGERDGTRHVVDLCHRHGIRYLAYYWAQREPPELGEEHPDWRCLSAAGKHVDYYCVNRQGYRELVRNRIVELVRDVKVDGIFFDMFHVVGGACYCDACRDKFRALTGQEPPLKEDFADPLWPRWSDFRFRSIEAALLEWNQAIKAANPDAALVINTWNAWVYRHPGNLRNSIRVAECVDGLLEETGWYDTVDPSFFAFPARHNFMCWHLAGLCRGRKAFMWAAGGVPGGLRLGDVEPDIRVMTMMTNGCVPAHSVPGRDVLVRYLAEIARYDDVVRGAEPYPWCGLVVSEKSELWYGRDDPKERYVKGVYGAFQALLERHLPVVLVTDRDLERGEVPPCRVLLLANTAAMSDAELATVRRYAEGGGRVVATYETSLYDEYGGRRDDFGLADLFGAKAGPGHDTRVMRSGWDPNHINMANVWFAPGHPWENDPVIAATMRLKSVQEPLDTVHRTVPIHCRMIQVEAEAPPGPGFRIGGQETNPETKQPEQWSCVGLTRQQVGEGAVVYLPFDLTWSYFRYGEDYLGRLLELALREAASEPPPVEVTAPMIVQTAVYTQGDRLVVHLLNDISSFGRSGNVARESIYVRREVIPIHDIQVTFRGGRRRFKLVPGDQELAPEATPDGRRVTVPRLDIHAAVVAE